MSIGAPPTDPAHAHPAGKAKKRRFPIVGVVALVVLIAIDIPALHALDESWGVAAGGGAVAALVGAVFAYTWFGGSSRMNLRLYFWKRLLALAIVTVLASVAIYFVLQFPLLSSFAAGLSVALCGGMALMLASGDL